jgi:hypothetical protein
MVGAAMIRQRGTALTVAAVLFGLLAVSNLSKPLELSPSQGFVFFGHRLKGTANAIAGPLFGLYLAAYAAGIWGMRRWALPMGVAYAGYVVANLLSFWAWGPVEQGAGARLFGLVYMVIAIGVSAGTAWLLAQRRADLV